MSDLEGLEYRAEVYKNIDGKVIGVHADDYLHLERRLQKLRDALRAENTRLREALGKALDRLDASAFTNAEHAQAAEILRAALQDT